MIGDICQFVGDLVGLLKAGEVDEAARVVNEASKMRSVRLFDCRQATVSAINRTLLNLQRQRDELVAAVERMPERERMFARVQVEEIASMILDGEITRLKAEKRRLSRPGG